MTTRPVTLTAAAAVEAAQGLTVLGLGLYVAAEAIIGRPHDRAGALALAGMAVLGGVAMLGVARGLWQVRRWSRAPALLTQIFAVIVAVSMFQADRQALGALVAAVAVAAAAALLSPPSTRSLAGE